MLNFDTAVFFSETEIFIPVEKREFSKIKMADCWEDITQHLYEKRKLYFVPAVSEFLYQDSQWFKKEIYLQCTCTYGSYNENNEKKSAQLFIETAHIIELPIQSFLVVKFRLPHSIEDFILANNWLSHVKLHRNSARLTFQDSSYYDLYDYYAMLAEEAGFLLGDNVSKLFAYNLLGVDLKGKDTLDKQDLFLLRLKDLIADSDETLLMTEYDTRSILQKWQSRISTFSTAGCMTIMSNEAEFNSSHYAEYYFSIYRDLALLAYYQVITLNTLSLRLANVDDLIENRRHIRETRKLILEFTNKAWFSQISLRPYAQILWDYWQKNLHIEKLYSEVSKQLDTLNGYIQQDRAWILTMTGGFLTALSWPFTFRKFAGIESTGFLYGAIGLVVLLLSLVVFDKFRATVYRKSGKLKDFFKYRK